MASEEMPLVGYQPKLLNRVEVAEGTMAFQFEKRRDLISSPDNLLT